MQRQLKSWTEIRVFPLENDKLVSDGLKLKGLESSNDYDWYNEDLEVLDDYDMKSACFV